MDEDSRTPPERTRRNYLTGAGALLAAGMFAGCSSGGSGDPTASATASPESTATEAGADSTPADDSTATASPEPNQPYTVSMVPVGEVEFESVPETWVANNGSWADMGIALGLEPPKGVWLTNRYHTQYYDEIPDLSVSKENMVSLWQDGVSKELFYELDADVHIMDPNFVINRFKNWKQTDIDEIESQIAPLFGNSIFAQHYPWHSDYRYYTLMEAFKKLAQVFQRMDHYEAMAAVHDDFQTNLAPVVPPQGERPNVAVAWGVGDEPEQFYPYVIGGGTGFKHLRSMKVRDAFASSDIKDFHGSRAAIDIETLLEVDPEVLMLRGYEQKSKKEFQNTVVSFLQNHDTASAITAVKNGDIYRAGGLYQGPITNLVLTERAASQLYDVDKELFDRQRVADIVNGNL